MVGGSPMYQADTAPYVSADPADSVDHPSRADGPRGSSRGIRRRTANGRGGVLPVIAMMGFTVAAACVPQTGPTPASGIEAPAASPAEMAYLELHKAIAAYVRCRDVDFTPQQREALETRVQRIVGQPLGASTMLSLIERARIEMAARIATQSCSSDAIAPYVDRFEADLATAVGS